MYSIYPWYCLNTNIWFENLRVSFNAKLMPFSDHIRVLALTVSVLMCVRRPSRTPQIKILKIQVVPTWAEHLHNMICDVQSSMLNTPEDYALWGYKSGFLLYLRCAAPPCLWSLHQKISSSSIRFKMHAQLWFLSEVISWESDKVIITVEPPLHWT